MWETLPKGSRLKPRSIGVLGLPSQTSAHGQCRELDWTPPRGYQSSALTDSSQLAALQLPTRACRPSARTPGAEPASPSVPPSVPRDPPCPDDQPACESGASGAGGSRGLRASPLKEALLIPQEEESLELGSLLGSSRLLAPTAPQAPPRRLLPFSRYSRRRTGRVLALHWAGHPSPPPLSPAALSSTGIPQPDLSAPPPSEGSPRGRGWAATWDLPPSWA